MKPRSMPDPTVAIIVPTFNRARYLPECLDSLLAQTFPATQIVVVNDGSTDDTAQVVRPYLNRIAYVEKENGGKSTALNLVMRGIQSDYVWIFDDDDVALPDALEIHVAVLVHITKGAPRRVNRSPGWGVVANIDRIDHTVAIHVARPGCSRGPHQN